MTRAQVKTLALLLALFFGIPVFCLVALGVIEWRTLSDQEPGNHITATLREAFRVQPGAVFLATLVWMGFLIAVFWGIAGHVFWGGRG